jgi:hypothetical protein
VDNDQIRAASRVAGRVAGKAAGRLAGKAARGAGKEWMPVVRNSGKFVKHVVPAAVKPLHTLWHEVLGFVFLSFAGMAGFRMWREADTMSPVKFIMIGVFIAVTAGYGISSILKARRISRS